MWFLKVYVPFLKKEPKTNQNDCLLSLLKIDHLKQSKAKNDIDLYKFNIDLTVFIYLSFSAVIFDKAKALC